MDVQKIDRRVLSALVGTAFAFLITRHKASAAEMQETDEPVVQQCWAYGGSQGDFCDEDCPCSKRKKGTGKYVCENNLCTLHKRKKRRKK